ncbi:DUF1631 domain-containing protein [Permianibacter sp. IMCC34836]|uniref:DUF1631 domain-containing protein n=1 Tax=Permianibacter fluminis TaxID=2738515 RepID=UPI001554E720|nr:DUF1631 domain-containing protein [Permianibacter fluminis]NQD37034.1 DUF1631 domain-containing protein [Permianibacter fluminis]
MAFEPHVMQFTSTGEPRRVQEQRKLPKLIERVRDQSLEALTKLFGHMLDTADDTLFDLADKAGNNKDQTLYFDAMRELRIKRKGMENVFRQELQNGFYDLVGRNENMAGAAGATYSLDSLSLVKEDELEENLAVDGMVSRAKQRNEEPLRYLARRFDAVVPDIRVEADDLPVYPKRICESFRSATKALGLDLRAKLVVFKLFERSVMAELPNVYDDLNLFFADNGVLPDLHVRKPRKLATPPPAAKRKVAEDDGLGDVVTPEQPVDIKAEVFNALRDLLAAQKGGGMAMGGAAGAFFDGGFGAPVVPVVETPQLLQALSKLQHDPGAVPVGQSIDLRTALAARLPVVVGGRVDASAVGAVNDDVIDIVSMMFDFILGDANLPDDIKAQLGRLQIPMLKVALVDKSFFSNRNHSARLLLNEMAYAGIGWDPDRRGRDGLQGRIETIVQRVLNEFEDDSRLFTELLEEFRGYCEEERRRSLIIEKRTKEAEEGKARSDSAKHVVDNLLQKVVAGRSLPPVAHKLLHDVWSKVLFLEHLRAGADSDAFRHAAQVADVLVRTVTVRTPTERSQLPSLIPGLIRQLRAGFESISYGALESSALLQDLEALHFQLMRAPVEPVVPEDSGLDDMVDNGVVAADFGMSSHDTDLLADALPDTSAEDAALLASINVEPVELPSGEELGEDIVMESAPDNEPDVDGYIDQVDALQVGSWIELREPDRNTRCKLAARIPTVGKLIFVNRSGVKVAEFTRPGMAVALRRGSVKLLDDAALFDRALEAVISNLRKLKDAADS